MNLKNLVLTFVRGEEGQDMLEYALLVALIAIAAVIAVTRAGTAVSGVFDGIAAKLEAAL